MQRMSRAQRLLTVYILLELLRKPKVVTRYRGRRMVAGTGVTDHHGLSNVTADQHHAKYTDAEAIAAVEGEATLDLTGVIPDSAYPNALLLDGSRAMAGDLDVGENRIILRDSLAADVILKNWGGGLGIRNAADDGWAPILGSTISATSRGIYGDYVESAVGFHTPLLRPRYETSDMIIRTGNYQWSSKKVTFQSPTLYTQTMLDCAILHGGLFEILRGGDFTFVAGKSLLNAHLLQIDEITTPTPVADHGQLYTKTDNIPYFQDGAGVEHAMAHGTKLDDHAAPDDNTDLNVSTTAHGLTPKLPNDAAKFLNGVGEWTVPAGGGGGVSLTVSTTEVFSGTSPTTWTDLDLSGTVGSNSALVALAFRSAADMNAVAVRTKGDTNEYHSISADASAYGVHLGHADADADMVLIVATDASGVIQWTTETAQTCTVDILWYMA